MTPDLAEKLGGRGAWVAADRALLTRAVARGLFARAFKQAATAPDNLIDSLDAALEKRALDALGLARRTGEAVLGFDQVKDVLTKGKASVLLTASDAADDGREKLSRLGVSRLGDGLLQHRGFSSAAMSAAFGRDGIKHAALLKGAAADRFRREALRLDGVRATENTAA